MEETLSPSDATTDIERGLASRIESRREDARQYMAEQQRRLGELEAALAHHIGHMSQQLQQARQSALETETELGESRGELEAATKKLRLDERGLAQLRRECEANAEELAYNRQRLQQRLAELDLERERLDELRAETKSQRLRIAHQLKADREENRRLFERECAELDQRRAALAEPEALARQLEEARQCLADAAQQVQHSEQPAAVQGGEVVNQALADMTRRYELAMEDLREQKRLVADLEKQAASAPRSAAPLEHGGKLDWEAQKQRLLASLEADSEDDDDQRRDERLKMREVIDRTDAAIAAKDREIEDLRQLLSSQTANIGEVAVGASAVADVLSSDEIVKTERERLQQLQQEWEEKLRQAEIDLSVQRARLARERAEIEERQRLLQEQQAGHATGGTDTSMAAKPQRGRWLARLGLKEDET
jgi:hypothetical protein